MNFKTRVCFTDLKTKWAFGLQKISVEIRRPDGLLEENKLRCELITFHHCVAESRQIVLDEKQLPQPVESTDNSFNETGLINEVERSCQANEWITESRVINLSDDDEPPRAEEFDWTNKLRSLIWYYLDPQGDVQGPFCLASLKNWKDADYFPSDFKVWKTGQTQDHAVLLSDILSPLFS